MLDTIISAEGLSVGALLLCTLTSVVLGVLSGLVHTYKNTYSKGLVVTLALLPVLVQAVIMMVNGNIGAGVAVAGAFSLVRFRSAPGSAREIAAVFTAVAVGIATGMGYVTYALVVFAAAAALTLLLFATKYGDSRTDERDLKITVPEALEYNGAFDDIFAVYTKKAELIRVKTTNLGSMFELQYRVTLGGDGNTIEKKFLDALRCRNGNLNVSCGKIGGAVREEL